MKYLLLLATLTLTLLLTTLLFTGCEVMHRPGLVIKEKVKVAGRYGISETMKDKVTINADSPGLSIVEAAGVKITYATVTTRTVTSALDPKTGITTVVETSSPGGMYVTEHVKARGAADKSRIDAVSAGVSGAIVSGAGAALVGPGLGAIPK